jgi:hypothetical protein
VVIASLRSAEDCKQAIADELVGVAVVTYDDRYGEVEQSVEPSDNIGGRCVLGERREPSYVEEEHADLELLTGKIDALVEDALGHGRVNVRAERFAQLFALAKAGDHPVEAGLQQADLAAVVDVDLCVEVAHLDGFERIAQVHERFTDRAARHADRQQPHCEAERGEHRARAGEPVPAHRVTEHRGDRDRGNTEQSRARTDAPRHRDAAGHARRTSRWRWPTRECDSDDRPDRAFDKEILQRARGRTTENCDRRDARCELLAHREVDDRDEDRADDPWAARQDRPPSRQSEREQLNFVRRRPSGAQPLLELPEATSLDEVTAGRQRDREVHGTDADVEQRDVSVVVRSDRARHEETREQHENDATDAVCEVTEEGEAMVDTSGELDAGV